MLFVFAACCCCRMFHFISDTQKKPFCRSNSLIVWWTGWSTIFSRRFKGLYCVWFIKRLRKPKNREEDSICLGIMLWYHLYGLTLHLSSRRSVWRPTVSFLPRGSKTRHTTPVNRKKTEPHLGHDSRSREVIYEQSAETTPHHWPMTWSPGALGAPAVCRFDGTKLWGDSGPQLTEHALWPNMYGAPSQIDKT